MCTVTFVLSLQNFCYWEQNLSFLHWRISTLLRPSTHRTKQVQANNLIKTLVIARTHTATLLVFYLIKPWMVTIKKIFIWLVFCILLFFCSQFSYNAVLLKFCWKSYFVNQAIEIVSLLLISDLESLLKTITSFSHHMGDCVIHGIATSHSAQLEAAEGETLTDLWNNSHIIQLH